MRIRRGLICLIGVASLLTTAALASGASVSAAPAAPAVSPAIAPAAQEFWWDWSDGSTASRRTFTQAQYGVQSNLPHLITHAVPAYPRRVVILQYWQDGSWHFENSAKTNSRGIATMDLDPYCSNDTWCDGTWKYRMKVAGQTARVTITYSER